ncbi:hypothetical protein AJ79_06550 [Helicocarpus griseus UAMH5409]|uniref:Uncharacterized protein n=1 Tax=Helicocarpus griseus UAMH5409 TaxID=1447875 RepID=A0A2B7XC52_9EURO|nr:hypothetical protein AJ79_06550 [Helicocarpus griseus UAMH5409]
MEQASDAVTLLNALLKCNRTADGVLKHAYGRLDNPDLASGHTSESAVTGLWNQSPLTNAILHGTAAEITGCLERQPSLGERNLFGQTALHLAVLRPSELSRLIEAGAEIDIKDNSGATPLCYAICYDRLESVMLLLEAGAIPLSSDKLDSQLSTSLLDALFRSRWETIRQFFSYLKKSKRVLKESQNDLADYYVANWLETLSSDDPDVTSKSGVTLLYIVHDEYDAKALFEAGFTKAKNFDDQANGCSPTTILLSSNSLDYYRMGHLLALEWLLMLKEHRGISIAQAALMDLVRVAQFNKLGMTHICCQRLQFDQSNYLDKEEIEEILEEERYLVQDLEEFMLRFAEKQGDGASVEETWLDWLSQPYKPSHHFLEDKWWIGTWTRSPSSHEAQPNPPWKNASELKKNWVYRPDILVRHTASSINRAINSE